MQKSFETLITFLYLTDLQESIESDLDDEKSNFVQVGDMALTKAQYQDLSGSRSRTFLRFRQGLHFFVFFLLNIPF